MSFYKLELLKKGDNREAFFLAVERSISNLVPEADIYTEDDEVSGTVTIFVQTFDTLQINALNVIAHAYGLSEATEAAEEELARISKQAEMVREHRGRIPAILERMS